MKGNTCARSGCAVPAQANVVFVPLPSCSWGYADRHVAPPGVRYSEPMKVQLVNGLCQRCRGALPEGVGDGAKG
jgi:hypothetical protein